MSEQKPDSDELKVFWSDTMGMDSEDHKMNGLMHVTVIGMLMGLDITGEYMTKTTDTDFRHEDLSWMRSNQAEVLKFASDGDEKHVSIELCLHGNVCFLFLLVLQAPSAQVQYQTTFKTK